jgi:energy-coupling factor transporter ATP-binding protein EcfA2
MQPARTLRDAYNAADPAVPLPSGDPRYVDCTDVRGERDVVQQMLKTITWSASNTAQLLTGHRGCGKSTELLRLKARLEEAGYAVIYFEADEDLDVNDIIYSDLLLGMARRIESQLRQEHDIALDPKLLENVQHWFAEVLYTEDGWRQVQRELEAEATLGVGLPEGVPILARLLARVTGQIKTGHDVREEIRRKLDPRISLLIENLNLLILRATERLRHQGRRGLVLLIDNLDPHHVAPVGHRPHFARGALR